MDYEKLGDNIRNYREQRGFTQEKLAELSNISEKHLSKIERGKINIKIDTLVNIADALGTSVDKLLLDASSFTKKARKITAVQNNGKQIHSGTDEPSDGYAKTIALLLLHPSFLMKSYKSEKYQRYNASGSFAGDNSLSGQ